MAERFDGTKWLSVPSNPFVQGSPIFHFFEKVVFVLVFEKCKTNAVRVLRNKVQKGIPWTAHSGWFDQYATTYYNQNYYYFGGGRWLFKPGSAYGYNHISRLDATSWSWSSAGKLKSTRLGHGVIRDGNRLVFKIMRT